LVEAARLATPVGHPFYERVNRLLDKRGFDAFAETAGESFYGKEPDHAGSFDDLADAPLD
jgi:hypothetical protein